MSTLLYTVDYANTSNMKAFCAPTSTSKSTRRTSSTRSSNASSLFDYSNSAAIKSFTSSRRPSNKGFSMKNALNQLKPTEEQIQPTGIYSPIIKRGALFDFSNNADIKAFCASPRRNSSKTDESSRKHSATQSGVDAALLR